MAEGSLARARGVTGGSAPRASHYKEQVADGLQPPPSSQNFQFTLSTARQLTTEGRWEPPSEPSAYLEVRPEADAGELEAAGQLRLPGYVARCQQRRLWGDDHGWSLRLEHRETGRVVTIPHECGSWRCEGDCRERYRRVEFARIRKALSEYEPHQVFFAVLTVGTKYRGIERSYAKLATIWPKLRKRLSRRFGDFEYVATVEEHTGDGSARGYPHMNLIICSRNPEMNEPGLLRWFKGAAFAAGWGYMASIEVADSAEAVAGYVSKASAGEAAAGEISKASQLPWHLPGGGRRLRSSRGFLPPRTTTGEWTGELVYASIEEVRRFERDFSQVANFVASEAVQAIRALARTLRGRAHPCWTWLPAPIPRGPSAHRRYRRDTACPAGGIRAGPSPASA